MKLVIKNGKVLVQKAHYHSVRGKKRGNLVLGMQQRFGKMLGCPTAKLVQLTEKPTQLEIGYILLKGGVIHMSNGRSQNDEARWSADVEVSSLNGSYEIALVKGITPSLKRRYRPIAVDGQSLLTA